MPATLTARVLDIADDVCGTCGGNGEEIDHDGSLTGLPGALLPCGECVTHLLHDRPGERCICWSPTWQHNAGHTGWVPVPPDYFNDDSPLLFTACLLHNTAVRAALCITPVTAVAA